MKTIVVSGAHSGIGKTLLAGELLKKLAGWSALKVTVKRNTGCPKDKNGCDVCTQLKRDFEIISDKKIINRKKTDTARLKDAGAKNVLWLKSTLKGLGQGLKRSFKELRSSKGVVIEGTSVLKHMKPDLLIFIKDSSKLLRKSAEKALKEADIIVNNAENRLFTHISYR